MNRPPHHRTGDPQDPQQVGICSRPSSGRPREDTVAGLVGEARTVLREKFFQSDVGITGGNFLIAETSTSVIVTNEAMATSPRPSRGVSIVTSGIERVLPTLDDLFSCACWRSATGQDTECYPRCRPVRAAPGDPAAPEEYHVVLVDNGRSKMLGSKFREMLLHPLWRLHEPLPGYTARSAVTPMAGSIPVRWARSSRRSSTASPNTTTCPTPAPRNGCCQSVLPGQDPTHRADPAPAQRTGQGHLMPASQRRADGGVRDGGPQSRLYHALERFGSRLLRARSRQVGQHCGACRAPGMDLGAGHPGTRQADLSETFKAMRGG